MNHEEQTIKDTIKSTFDKVAKSYDTNLHFILSAQKMVELIHCETNPLNILDLSTGTGHIAIELAKKFPDANIYGVDISDEMLSIARSKTKEQGIGNITYLAQDVENLDFDGMKFGLITCGYALFFYPNMDKVVSDISARLSDGGKFIFSTFTDQAFQPYSKLFLEMLERDYTIVPPKRIEKRQLTTKGEIKTLCECIAYDALEIHNVEIVFPMDIHEWWKLLNSTGYKGLLAQLESNYSQFEKEYLEHLKSISKDECIDFNANSLISVVTINMKKEVYDGSKS
ncbi:MAG: class I SAM-dependent methyltransferase [Sulfuricurvum sp.]